MGQEIFSVIPTLVPGVFIFFVADLTNLIIHLSYLNILRPKYAIILCYKKLEGQGRE